MTDTGVEEPTAPADETLTDSELKRLIEEHKLALIGISGIVDRARCALWGNGRKWGLFWRSKRNKRWNQRVGDEVSIQIPNEVKSLIYLTQRLNNAGLTYGHIGQQTSGTREWVQEGWFNADGVVPFTGPAMRSDLLDDFPFLHPQSAEDEEPADIKL